MLVAEQVSVLSQTPSAVGVLSPQGLGSVALVVGGEACPAEVVDRWAPGRVMIMVWPDRDDDVCGVECAVGAGVGVVPIGAPVPGAALFVLDGWLRAVPAGVVGSCMWPGGGRCGVLAPGLVDRVAVCGVPVRLCRGADVSQRGFGALGA